MKGTLDREPRPISSAFAAVQPDATHMTQTPGPDSILKTGLGFMAAKTLLSAIELGVFTELAKTPLDGATLTERLKLHSRSARDFLDTLVSLKMLEREAGVYSNTPETDLYLDRAKPSYIGGLLEMVNMRLYGFWGSLTEALRTGQPQNEAKRGQNTFEKLYSDAERLENFLKAMTGISLGPARAIAEKFWWSNYKTFVDVGCAEGALPVQVARRHPHLKGFGYDLPIVQPIFQRYVHAQGVADRVHFRAGDFFKDASLPTAEVIVMGHILHDWNLEEKKILLRKAYEALPNGGAIIAYDCVIDDERRENTLGLIMSLNMLIETKGGFDYTQADCQRWMREIGFRKTSVEHLIGPESMVIGIK
jgi:hypothetical protein